MKKSKKEEVSHIFYSLFLIKLVHFLSAIKYAVKTYQNQKLGIQENEEEMEVESDSEEENEQVC